MAIVDGRTSLDTWETNQPDDLTGAAGGTADTEIFIQGSQSYGYYTTTTRDGLLYDAGSAQDWSNNTFYFWFNTGIAGLLDTKANGGVAARFCGATVTDWFEVNLAGSDDYPVAINGGWVMFVVDVEKAKVASNRTNGTPPATTAIRYAGITTVTATAMPRMVDNTWLDACWRLPQNTAGIRVEGQNTGSVDWTWADIVSTAESNAWGTAKNTTGGAIAINTPIQFGANDAVTHGFSDTNKIILWEDWDVATSFYGLTVVGGSGTQSFELGIKTGTGTDASGAQGCVIAANSVGERWFFDCDDANVDACNLYGSTFIHGGDFQLDGTNVSCISDNFLDCSSAVQSQEFLRCSIVDANTADGVAFLTSSNPGNIANCTFEFSDGHAIEIDTTGTFTFDGNVFTGYGANGTNDAAIYNSTGTGTVTLNLQNVGAVPTVRTAAGGNTVAEITVTVSVEALDADTSSAVSGARVLLLADTGGDLPAQDSVSLAIATSTVTVTHTSHGLSTGNKVVIKGVTNDQVYNGIKTITVSDANTYTYTVSGTPASPTGTPTSTAVILDGDTNVSGILEDTGFSFTNPQPITGRIRKGTSSTYYKTAAITGTISSTGFSSTIFMIKDE